MRSSLQRLLHGESAGLGVFPDLRGPGWAARSSARSRFMFESWSGAGGHVSGEDVVGMAVEILAGSVIAHRGPRVSVAGRDLHVAQVHARVEHGRDIVCRSICG